MKLEPTRQTLALNRFEPDQLAGVLSGGCLEHYILGSAVCHARLSHWACGGLTVDSGRYSFPVRVLGEFPGNRVSIGYMRDQKTPALVNGFNVSPGTLEIYPAGCEMNYRAGDDAEWVAIQMGEKALQTAALARLGRELNLPRGRAASYRMPLSQMKELDCHVRRLTVPGSLSGERIGAFTGFLAELLHHATLGGSSSLQEQSRRRMDLVQRADTFLRNHAGRPFDVRELANAVGTTQRSLQRHFTNTLGMTPHGWARCLALHRAHRMLRAADPRILTVEGIAIECGFHHPGRFAEYYRDLFLEPPSATLQRS